MRYALALTTVKRLVWLGPATVVLAMHVAAWAVTVTLLTSRWPTSD